MNKPLVIDIYRGDQVTSFQAVKDSGIIGVIHKATQGLTFVDNKYAARRKGFTDIGVAWAAYHFYEGRGAAEADHFLNVSEPDENTMVALDWENVPNRGGYAPTANEVQVFLERIEEKLGRKAVIYSGNVAKERLRGYDPYFAQHRLWHAQYGMHWSVQESWTSPWLWQNNGDAWGPGPHTIPGIGNLCDNNTLVGAMTAEDLLREWSGKSNPVPPPTPPTPDVEHDTEWLQARLNELGADPRLIVDGKYGPKTRAAVSAFQTKAGIHVDGIAGPETFAKLTA